MQQFSSDKVFNNLGWFEWPLQELLAVRGKHLLKKK
jgi:hypothetical protein